MRRSDGDIKGEMQSIRVLSWNVASRTACDKQVAAIYSRRLDIVALQEVTERTAQPFEKAIIEIGLKHIVNSFELASDRNVLTGPRRYGEIIASKWPRQVLPPATDFVPWPARLLSAVIASPLGRIELHATHIPPGSSNGWVKIDVLEGIYKYLARGVPHPRILCGDFNTPQAETPKGEIVTWGQRIAKGRKVVLCRWRRGGNGERWDQAERNILKGLAQFDLFDVYRQLHGYTAKGFSWYTIHAGKKRGRRFDHVLASRSLNAVECRYLHSFRELKLSDHSPIEVHFRPTLARRGRNSETGENGGSRSR